MQIEEKCHNCGKENLIDRPWRNDVFCGWCGTVYKRNEGVLYITQTASRKVKKGLKLAGVK